jgi:NADH-quinone oxidoreductase subunit H
LKLFFKEDIVPAQANKIIFTLAPILVLVPALIGFAVIPFGRDSIHLFGLTFHPYVTDINIGILYILAFASIGAYGVLLGGWASNNKYSLLGGLRSAAQVISYELSLGLAIVGVLLMAGSLSLVKITEAQGGGLFHWFIIPQFVAFVIYLISAIAETNRLPFDLPEAESELVAGFFTEYSGMRFAFFFLAEYANMILVSCIATILFLGGWHAPIAALEFIPPILWFLGKVYLFLFFYIWIRGTLPRLRYDQLMMFGWKIMIPLALANILVTSAVLYFIRG